MGKCKFDPDNIVSAFDTQNNFNYWKNKNCDYCENARDSKNNIICELLKELNNEETPLRIRLITAKEIGAKYDALNEAVRLNYHCSSFDDLLDF